VVTSVVKSPLLVFGGTFNPIHTGHLSMAQQALDVFESNCMLLVPSAVPPHRDSPEVTAEHRLRMVELAVQSDDRLYADAREIRRGGTSYTVDTLAEIRSEVGDDRAIIFCLGADAFNGLTGWHEWNRLFDFAHICVISRPDQQLHFDSAAQSVIDDRGVTRPEALLDKPFGHVLAIDCEPMDVSSTHIRERIRQGLSCELLLTQPVYNFIVRSELYR